MNRRDLNRRLEPNRKSVEPGRHGPVLLETVDPAHGLKPSEQRPGGPAGTSSASRTGDRQPSMPQEFGGEHQPRFSEVELAMSRDRYGIVLDQGPTHPLGSWAPHNDQERAEGRPHLSPNQSITQGN